jgi:integrase
MNLNEKLKNTYERVRDHFVLSCFLGQRFSDTVRITSTNFDKSAGKFKITQQKTGNKAVVCFNDVFGEFPIIAREILEKYEYNAPWTGTMSTFNQRLHEICKHAGLDDWVKHEVNNRGAIVVKSFPKYELICSHCARRTFITNCVKRGLHSQQIKRASGHTSDKSFGLYVIWGDDVD